MTLHCLYRFAPEPALHSFFRKWPKLAVCLLGFQDHPVQRVLKDLGISLEKEFSVRQLLRRLCSINCAGTLLGLLLKDEEGQDE